MFFRQLWMRSKSSEYKFSLLRVFLFSSSGSAAISEFDTSGISWSWELLFHSWAHLQFNTSGSQSTAMGSWTGDPELLSPWNPAWGFPLCPENWGQAIKDNFRSELKDIGGESGNHTIALSHCHGGGGCQGRKTWIWFAVRWKHTAKPQSITMRGSMTTCVIPRGSGVSFLLSYIKLHNIILLATIFSTPGGAGFPQDWIKKHAWTSCCHLSSQHNQPPQWHWIQKSHSSVTGTSQSSSQVVKAC